MPSQSLRDGAPIAVIGAVVATLALGSPAQAAAAAPQAKVESGVLAGVRQDDVSAFLGVPYAAPPVGKLRWAAPAPAARWTGVRPATAFGAKCPSVDWAPPRRVVGAEDCLFLNVYAPANAKGSLPVAVWFHGGGFTAGSSQDVDPRRFAAKANVVVVTVNYRLGALGFASLPEAEAEAGGSGNYALLDQQAALAWVQRNIGAFGGDKKRVTAIGESAGAFSIWTHIASPGAAGLFQRAITMSGPNASLADGMPMVDRKVEQQEGPSARLAKEFGCPADKPLACLREVPAEKLVTAGGGASWVGWTIILDGKVLPEQPKTRRENRKIAKIPVLSGATENEGGFFSVTHRFGPNGGWTPADYRASIEAAPQGSEILAAYPPEKAGTPDDTYALAVSDQWACGTLKINTLHSQVAPVYAYEFADREAPATLFAFPGAPKGAFHTAEIPYVFQTAYPSELHRTPPALSPAQQALSDRMLAHWGDFIWGRGLKDWPRFDAGGAVMILAPEGDRAMPTADFRTKHNCDFWDRTPFGDWLVNTANLARKR